MELAYALGAIGLGLLLAGLAAAIVESVPAQLCQLCRRRPVEHAGGMCGQCFATTWRTR